MILWALTFETGEPGSMIIGEHVTILTVDRITFIILTGQHDQYNEAVDCLATYEEENSVPSRRTLRYLAKALEREGLPVPFEAPESQIPKVCRVL